MKSTDVILYVFLIFIFWFAFKSEKLDLFCPTNCENSGKTERITEFCGEKCGDGKGKYYVDGIGNENDKVEKLLEKIEWLSDFDTKTTKWRRAYMLAFLIALLSLMISLKTFPSGEQLIVSIIIAFIVIYISFSYYNYHYERYPVYYTKKNIEHIRKKLKMKTPVLNLLI